MSAGPGAASGDGRPADWLAASVLLAIGEVTDAVVTTLGDRAGAMDEATGSSIGSILHALALSRANASLALSALDRIDTDHLVTHELVLGAHAERWVQFMEPGVSTGEAGGTGMRFTRALQRDGAGATGARGGLTSALGIAASGDLASAVEAVRTATWREQDESGLPRVPRTEQVIADLVESALLVAWDPLRSAESSLRVGGMSGLPVLVRARADCLAGLALLTLGVLDAAEARAAGAADVFDAARRSGPTASARAAISPEFAVAADLAITAAALRRRTDAVIAWLRAWSLEYAPDAQSGPSPWLTMAAALVPDDVVGDLAADDGDGILRAGYPDTDTATFDQATWWWGMRRTGDRIVWAVTAPEDSGRGPWCGWIPVGEAMRRLLAEVADALPVADRPMSESDLRARIEKRRRLVTPTGDLDALVHLGHLLVPEPLRHALSEQEAGDPVPLRVTLPGSLALLPIDLLGLPVGKEDIRMVDRAVLRQEARVRGRTSNGRPGDAGKRSVTALLANAMARRQLADRLVARGHIRTIDPDGGTAGVTGAIDRAATDQPASSVLVICAHAGVDANPFVLGTPDAVAGQFLDLHGGGQLAAPDIASMDFGRAFEGVLLCACRSGGGTVVGNDEPLGLAPAFLSSGVPWVIATRWPIYFDDHAAGLVLELVDALAAGIEPQVALREVTRERLAEGRRLAQGLTAERFRRFTALDTRLSVALWGAWMVLVAA